MKGASFKTKVRETVEKQTIDKLVSTTHKSENEFMSDLWKNVGESGEFTDALKEKLETEQKLYEEAEAERERLKEKENEQEGEGQEQSEVVEKVIAKPVVSAEEIKPELVEYIKCELMEQMETKRGTVVDDFISSISASEEDFHKLQLWSYFPVLGVPIYFFFLTTLSINVHKKYAVSLQNYAKSQLRTFWIYCVAHASVVFVSVASMTSFINIIQRGLAA